MQVNNYFDEMWNCLGCLVYEKEDSFCDFSFRYYCVNFACFFQQKSDYIFVGNDDCFFGMSKSSLTKKLGEPTFTNNNSYDASMDEYIYMTGIHNYKATYNFYFFKSRLIEMSLTVGDFNYDFAISMVEKIIDKQNKYYSIREGYYLSEMKTINNLNFSVSNGVDYGATGISFDYEYVNNKLTINAIRQE